MTRTQSKASFPYSVTQRRKRDSCSCLIRFIGHMQHADCHMAARQAIQAVPTFFSRFTKITLRVTDQFITSF